ncbi:DUF1810 family protein [Flavobacterium sp. ARAG 55.4]|uniref:DUF1810 family protein n=1 Tax=Flavobacterium sp. ARAG 55.4 TaxID=3451357 RepID=UPI003F467AA2
MGLSKTSALYGISDLNEEQRYLSHPVLEKHLIEILPCRGLKNKNSKHHKMILNLRKKNLYKVHSHMKKNKL